MISYAPIARYPIWRRGETLRTNTQFPIPPRSQGEDTGLIG